MNHSETPWKMEWNGGSQYKIIGTVPFLSGEDGTPRIPGIAFNLSREDAAFIVRAVNAHDELIAALQKIASLSSHLGRHPFDYEEIASAALAKAKGE